MLGTFGGRSWLRRLLLSEFAIFLVGLYGIGGGVRRWLIVKQTALLSCFWVCDFCEGEIGEGEDCEGRGNTKRGEAPLSGGYWSPPCSTTMSSDDFGQIQHFTTMSRAEGEVVA